MIILLLLTAIDILSGSVLLLNLNFFVNYIAVILLLKGLFSLLSSLGIGYWFDWMGVVDIISAVALFLFYLGLPAAIFSTIAWIIIFKGSYSFLRTIFRF